MAECHFKGCESAGQLLECVAIVEEEVVGLWRAEGRMLTRVEARERNATFYKMHLQHGFVGLCQNFEEGSPLSRNSNLSQGLSRTEAAST